MEGEHTNGILAILILCAVVIACSGLTDGKPAAEKGVAEFHSKFNDWKFDEIYAGADQRFKDATSEAEMDKLLTAVHTKLGVVKQSTSQNWRVSNYNLTNYFEIVQDTEFEKGKGTETFTFVIEDKKAILGGYYINSMDLMSN